MRTLPPLLLALILFTTPASADNKVTDAPPWYNKSQCTAHKARQAIEADDVTSWDELYHWFRNFKVCDEHWGDIGESFDDAVAQLMARHWKDFPRLLELFRRDAEFKNFVLSYTGGGTANYGDLRKAKENAKTTCPRGAADMCAEIVKRIGNLLEPWQMDPDDPAGL